MRFLQTMIFLISGIYFSEAQNFEKITPRVPQAKSTPLSPSPDSDKEARQQENLFIIPQLKKIYLVPDETEMPSSKGDSSLSKDHSPDADTSVISLNLPLLNSADFQKKIQPYLWKPASLQTLQEISKKVVQFYQQNNYPVVDVWIPEQEDVSEGVVYLIVTESKLGEIRVKGNRYFSTQEMVENIHLENKGRIESIQLREGVSALNENPFQQVEPYFVPGKETGTTDIELRVKERFPLQAYAGYEDTGTKLTGDDRYFTGFYWGDAWGLRHLLGYQFTTSQNFENISAHSVSYTIPFANHHRLTFQGSYSESEAEVTAPFQLKGKSWTAGTRYIVPLLRGENWSQEIEGGFDFKQTNSNLDFGGINVFQNQADIDNFVLGYRWQMSDTGGETEASIHGYYSPGNLTENNDDAHFRSFRSFAGSRYIYGRGEFKRVQKLPLDFLYEGRFSGQYTENSLMPSEMWNAGGWGSVRGYDEFEASGDRGWNYQQEIKLPAISFGKWGGLAEFEDELRFIGFYDMGWTQNRRALEGEKETHYLMGAGAGLRYTISRYLSLRFDYGFQLHEKELNPEHSQRAHLSVVISY